jgi:hypothetical protein
MWPLAAWKAPTRPSSSSSRPQVGTASLFLSFCDSSCLIACHVQFIRSSPCCEIVPSAAAGLRVVSAWARTSEKQGRTKYTNTLKIRCSRLVLLNIPVTIMLWRPPLVLPVIRFPLPVLSFQTTWIWEALGFHGGHRSWALLSLLFQRTPLLPSSLLPPRRPPAPATRGASWRRCRWRLPPPLAELSPWSNASPVSGCWREEEPFPSLTGVKAFLQGGAPRMAPAPAAAAGGGRGRRPERGGAARPRP